MICGRTEVETKFDQPTLFDTQFRHQIKKKKKIKHNIEIKNILHLA